MSSRWAQVALGLAGLGAIAWALVFAANPTITCRDVVMAPGQVCVNADSAKVQTYEQRYAATSSARPVIGVLGAGLVIFAVVLARGSRPGQASSDIGP